MNWPDSSKPEVFLKALRDYLDGPIQRDGEDLIELPQALSRVEETNPREFVQAIETLGDFAGLEEEWREPFGKSGLLSYICEQLDSSSNAQNLSKQCLRVIGNSVADYDANREITLPWAEKLISCLAIPKLLGISLIVLFNLCNEFDKGQEQLARLRFDKTICALLSDRQIDPHVITNAIDLLFWSTEKLSSTELIQDDSISTYLTIVDLALQCVDDDDYQSLFSICLLYLQDQEFQKKAVKQEILAKTLGLLSNAVERHPTYDGEPLRSQPERDATENEQEKPFTAQLVDCLSSISINDTYASEIPLDGPVVSELKSFLSSNHSILKSCACIMLGNLAVSDEVAIFMVEKLGLHIPLVRILRTNNDKNILYAAGGFVRHLTFPVVNRKTLASAGLRGACFRLLEFQELRVRREGAAILRKLVSEDMESIQELLTATSRKASPEIGQRTVSLYADSLFSELLHAADSGPLGIEIGRTIVATLRLLHRAVPPSEAEPWLRNIYAHDTIVSLLLLLARQDDGVLLSEGLLGLGLMAQRKDGASLVVRACMQDPSMFKLFKKTVNPAESPKREPGTDLSLDQRNTLVLIHGLLANADDLMDIGTRLELQNIQSN